MICSTLLTISAVHIDPTHLADLEDLFGSCFLCVLGVPTLLEGPRRFHGCFGLVNLAFPREILGTVQTLLDLTIQLVEVGLL